MILYLENPKDNTRNLLDLINEFGKVAGSKINTEKLIVFLYTKKNQRSVRDIRETFPFTIISKRIKYLEINISKETKDLYSENSKTIMKSKDDTDVKIYQILGLQESILSK